MIRLTSLLLEAQEAQTINALFIGDIQTTNAISYARKILKTKFVNGEVDGNANANITELDTILQNNMLENYDVVTIFPGLVKGIKSPAIAIQTLTTMFNTVKQYDCLLVVINSPSAEFTPKPELYEYNDEIAYWISSQTNIDVVIETADFNKLDFNRTGTMLDDDAQNIIAKQWLDDVLPLLQSSNDLDVIDTDNKIDVNTEQIKELQVKLLSLGYLENSDDVTGKMDINTKIALSQFQRDQDIKPSGTIDTSTTKKLNTVADTGDSKLTKLVPKKVKRTRTVSHNNFGTATTVIDFFVDKGLSEAGAAGIAGNLFFESGFETDNPGDHGTSNGLAQWHEDRWWGENGFEAWCTRNGLDPWSVNGQLEFLWWELSTGYRTLTDKLKNEDITPEEAAYSFARVFERPAYISNDRKTFAAQFYDDYTSTSII